MSKEFYNLYAQMQTEHNDADEKLRRLVNVPYTDSDISFMRFQKAAQLEQQARQDTFDRYDAISYVQDMEAAWKADSYRSVVTKSGLIPPKEGEEDLSDKSDDEVINGYYIDRSRFLKEYKKRGLDRSDGLTYEAQIEQAWKIQ